VPRATIVALKRWQKIGFLGDVLLTLAPTSSLIPIASEVGASGGWFAGGLSVLAVFAALRLERLTSRKVAIVLFRPLARQARTAYRFAIESVVCGSSPLAAGTFAVALGTLMDAGRHRK
jgi:hypothetical protein